MGGANEKAQIDEDEACSRFEKIRQEMMGVVAESLERTDACNRERREDRERSRAREERLYRELMAEKDEHHKAKMQQKEKHHNEMKEQQEKHHNEMKQFTEMFKTMLAETLAQQTKQIEALVKGMDSITESVKQMQMLTEKSNTSKKIEDGTSSLTKPCVVVMDNFGPFDDLRDFIDKDQETLKTQFETIGADVKRIRKGESLTTASKEFGQEDFSKNNAIVVCAFSPGCNMMLMNGTRPVEVQKICEPFGRNPTLKGKPKIFLFHAIQKPELNCEENELSPEDDVLVCYCEVGENLYRENSTEVGSFLIKSLAYVFHLYWKKCDIAEILEKVRSEVTKGHDKDISFSVASKLQKKVYFG